MCLWFNFYCYLYRDLRMSLIMYVAVEHNKAWGSVGVWICSVSIWLLHWSTDWLYSLVNMSHKDKMFICSTQGEWKMPSDLYRISLKAAEWAVACIGYLEFLPPTFPFITIFYKWNMVFENYIVYIYTNLSIIVFWNRLVEQ